MKKDSCGCGRPIERRSFLRIGLGAAAASAAGIPSWARPFQETRVQARVLEQPREHGRGRRLAVRTGHREHPLVAQHVLGQPLRARREAKAGVEDRFQQRIAARDHVADHEHVGIARDAVELIRREALGQSDAQRLELRAHRRVYVGIAAADAMAGRVRGWQDQVARSAKEAGIDAVRLESDPTKFDIALLEWVAERRLRRR